MFRLGLERRGPLVPRRVAENEGKGLPPPRSKRKRGRVTPASKTIPSRRKSAGQKGGISLWLIGKTAPVEERCPRAGDVRTPSVSNLRGGGRGKRLGESRRKSDLGDFEELKAC